MAVNTRGARSGRELQWIRWIRSLEARSGRHGERPRELLGTGSFPLGIGDDAAIWTPRPGSSVVLTVDAQVEGVHFRREWSTWREIGERAVAASLSDLAAMAARPVAVLASLVLEPGMPARSFREIQRGIHAAARRYGARVLGGNLSSGPVSLTITAIGEGKAEALVRRSGAAPGDEIWVTGTPGLARLGLLALERGLGRGLGRGAGARDLREAMRAFLRPRARLAEALEIVRELRPTAMIDLSDGLAADLRHVLEESSRARGRSLGAVLEERAVHGLPRLVGLARRLGEEPLAAALRGGEDYELLFTTAPRASRVSRMIRMSPTSGTSGTSPTPRPGRGGPESRALALARRLGLDITRVGRVERGKGICLEGPGGERRAVTETGWDHFAGRSPSAAPPAVIAVRPPRPRGTA
ncbi:MAG: thiamine-phosphate kinase [Planctomycetes bacterium]|nr:thiamine-phosphate kinase [Planctomycetota bacterium]